jgi:hypothetical protein
VIEALGVAGGNVAGDAFVKAESRKEAKGRSEALLAVAAFFGGIGENGRTRDALHEGTVRWRSG